MKKTILLLLLSITLLLSGCTPKETTQEQLDCAVYPNHVDCAEDPDPEPEPIDCDVTPNHEDCVVPVVEYDFIDIFYMNDFHGAIEADGDRIGMSGIAAYIENHEETYPDNTLVISGGDMLQGSALSNYFNGYSTIEIMNEMGFDAFVLGNHEFDWGVETVTDYFDGDLENGEADFPLLAANVFYKDTDTLLENAVPYVVYDIYDIQIGIIGTIGQGLEYSIATSKVEGFEFRNPVPIIAEYAEELRTTMGCEIVIWVGHDTGSINEALAALTGNQSIDAVFNGHSHSDYAHEFLGIPAMQSSSTGKALGHVRIYFDETGVTDYDVENLSLYSSALFSTEDPGVELLVDAYKEETDALFSEVLIHTVEGYNQTELSRWLCEVIINSTDSDIAFQNYGGTRTNIDSNKDITIATLYEIWPFDNQIKTVTLKGDVVNHLIQYGGMAYATDITVFDNDLYYKVATNDYVFDKTSNPFLDGTDIEITQYLLRDVVEIELRLQNETYDNFDTDNEILITP